MYSGRPALASPLADFSLVANVVSKSKASKIEPNCTYPCPCRKPGELHPIVLTEALGCSRCHHIFVVHEDGYTLEHVSGVYPTKQRWYWSGQGWCPTQSQRTKGWTWCMGLLLCSTLLVLLLGLHIRLDARIVVWVVSMLILSTMAWLILFRQGI
ncbi:MAG: hypothetical protein MH252_02335 [Thermosynechococcaceae cyanobacterium MS004]|nr:hypothetical protein [Thermosynechococcaceae cyanobacterium MS004]